MPNLGTEILLVEPAATLPDAAGSKARCLARMQALGLRVPPAWVVLPGTQREKVEALGSTLREKVPGPLIVRSSAAGEDEATASFAGVHLSLAQVSPDQLYDAVREVSASATTARAQEYRRTLGLPPATALAAAIVQPQLAARLSGVAFDGMEGRGSVRIELVRGSGERLQSAAVRPERVDVDEIADELHVARRRSGSDAPDSELLADAEAREIARAVATLRAEYDVPVDVEWVLTETGLFFVQVRPQTTSRAPTLPANERWTRANLGEVFPEIPSAFTRSVLPHLAGTGMTRMLEAFGARCAREVSYCTCVSGRPVLNERMYALADLVGMPGEWARTALGGSNCADDATGAVALVRALRHPLVGAQALYAAWATEGRVRAYLARVGRTVARWERGMRSGRSLRELLSHARGPCQRMAEEATYLQTCLFSVLLWRYGEALHLLRTVPQPRATLARLLAGGRPTPTARQLEDLLATAALVRETTNGAAFAEEVRPEHAERQTWRLGLTPSAWAAVERWIATWGHRGAWESDLARPRYGEDLQGVARILFPLVRTSTLTTPATRKSGRAADAESARMAVGQHLSRRARHLLHRRVGHLRRLTILREAMRDRTMLLTRLVRGLVLEIGRRVAARGQLDAASDVWHLSADELERAVARPAIRMQAMVARERSRCAAWRRIHVPQRFTSEDVAGFSASAERTGSEGTVLRGIPVGPGVAQGRVRILDTPDHCDELQDGEILVTHATDPAWAPLFARAAAVIVELGGTLSHASIVAREFGVPYVADVRDVTRILKTGDCAFVDGATGEVVLLPSPGGP